MYAHKTLVTLASLAAAGLLLTTHNGADVRNTAQQNPLTGTAISESAEPRPQPPTTEEGNLAPQPDERLASPCPNRKARACVDLSTNRTWLLDNGKVIYGPVPITHGRAGYATPTGTFKVQFKSRYHRSRLFNYAPMPYSVFFHHGIAFHQGNLRNLSHGCIRLSAESAQKYFATLKVGDVVQVVR
ncbi:L,D-transpeptidase [Allokutzneria albata]|uniref:L,D-transpeptidase catalytic domain n=1 Tax=Allokutzneria albata TaxID=211114 RepID=A0A1G9VKP3_ALLAB|nr:L,D-transpeptidase [Allokutzneria albata]SDM72686.1 L,D-transpeptidase catalytic domain [Allokutzneria albata]